MFIYVSMYTLVCIHTLFVWKVRQSCVDLTTRIFTKFAQYNILNLLKFHVGFYLPNQQRVRPCRQARQKFGCHHNNRSQWTWVIPAFLLLLILVVVDVTDFARLLFAFIATFEQLDYIKRVRRIFRFVVRIQRNGKFYLHCDSHR